MFGSLIFGAVAGYLVVHAEPLLDSALERALGRALRLDALDVRVLTFGVMLVLAGVATALARGDGSVVLAAAGGVAGYFGTRIYAFLRDPDGAQGDPDDDWSGDVAARRSGRGPEQGQGTRPQQGPDPDAETLGAVRAALSDPDPRSTGDSR